MTAPRKRSLARLRTSSAAYTPTELLQTPQQAKTSDRRGYGWGPHLPVQRTALIVMAIAAGNHAVSEVHEYIEQVDPELNASTTQLRKLCKSMALTGLLTPYIEALPQSRRRFMFFLPWNRPDLESDEWRHLLTIDESNERVPEPESALTKRWIE